MRAVIDLLIIASLMVLLITLTFSGIAFVADGIANGWGHTGNWYRYGGAVGFVWGSLLCLRESLQILAEGVKP